MGDASGAPYEGYDHVTVRSVISNTPLLGGWRYTDDSEMMKGVIESLITNKGFNGAHMAQTFVNNFHYERGYGPGAIRVLMEIKSGRPWEQPAKELFDGAGSLGNGAAMRTCPIGLLYHHDWEKMVDIATKVADITHCHPLGREGAVLQAAAVALAMKSTRDFSPVNFVERLEELKISPVYREKLEKIKNYLDSPPTTDVIVEKLGVEVIAPRSVPTAIYIFLRNYQRDFLSIIRSAVNHGGDTDTIACMVGSIAGAHLGVDNLPEKWIEKVEDGKTFTDLTSQLYALFKEMIRT
jgi:poly(ADP-ribose) glycohydrolase ARH3